MMKLHGKKGMALASTLIMMTIVTMLCVLMLTVSLYGSQLAALTTEDLRLHSKLELIGNDFVEKGDASAFLEDYVDNHNYKYYSASGNITESATNVAKTTRGDKLTFVVSYVGNKSILTVKTNRQQQLMRIVISETRVGGVSTVALESWNYGMTNN